MLSVFAIYISVYLFQYFNSPVLEITKVSKGVMDLTNFENGIIIRNETVYENSVSGNIIYNTQNNQKVAKNDEILYIVEGSEENTADVAVTTNSQSTIFDYEENYNLYNEDIKASNENIKKYVNGLEIDTFRELYLAKDYIESELTTRNRYLVNSVDLSSQVQSNVAKETLVSEKSGIVSYTLDGYEDIITYDKIADITEEYTKMPQSENEFSNKQSTLEKEKLYKIVDDNTWYILSYIENEKLEDITEDNYHKLYLSDGADLVEIWFYVESIEKGEKTSKVLFKTTKRILDFMEYRNLEFKLYDEVYSGLKIPLSSIKQKEVFSINMDYINQEGDPFVLKELSEGNTSQIPINIWLSDSDKGVTYLEPEQNTSLKSGDILRIQDSDEVFQIQGKATLNGVLKVNNGFAEFKPIEIDENIPTDRDVTILNSKKNKYIKEHDKIVTFADSIEENERISK